MAEAGEMRKRKVKGSEQKKRARCDDTKGGQK